MYNLHTAGRAGEGVRYQVSANLHTLMEGDIQWKPSMDELPVNLEYLVKPDNGWPWFGHFWPNVEVRMLSALSGQESLTYCIEPGPRDALLLPKLTQWVRAIDAERGKYGFVRTPWGKKVLADKKKKVWDVCLSLILASVAQMKLMLAGRIMDQCGDDARIVYTTPAGIWWAVKQTKMIEVIAKIKGECEKAINVNDKLVVWPVEYRERA